MASRRSHAASHSRTPISTVSRWDTYLSETHCKLRRSAAVGQTSPHPLLVPQSGTDYQPQHHRGCVSPPSGRVFLIKEQLHPKSLKKILRQTGCAPLPTPLVLTLQSKMVVNNYTKIIRTQMIIKISL